MIDYTWTTGTSGDWSNAADWTGGVPNGTTAGVTIAATGSYTVTIGIGEQFTVGSLALDDAGATLLIAGSLTLAGPLTLTAGAVDLNGTISGGTIVDPDGALVATGGTLGGVSYQGTLDLEQSFSQLTLLDGFTMTGAGGSGTGTILDTGYDSAVFAGTTETLDNVTIDLGNRFGLSTLGVSDPAGAGIVLTLGPGATLVETGPEVTLSSDIRTGDGIVNDGTITAGILGGTFTIDAETFTNAGTLTVTNGDTLDLTAVSLVNTGKIVVSGAKLVLDAAEFSSTGSFTLSDDSSIVIEGNLTLDQLDTISKAYDEVTIAGTLDLAGETLSVGSYSSFGTITVTGTIADGILKNPEAGLDLEGGTLESVTLDGALDLYDNDEVFTIAGGLATGGDGNATITLGGNNDSIDILGSVTLSGLTLNLSGAEAGNIAITAGTPGAAAATITLASNDVVNVTNNTEQWYEATTDETLHNQGTIEVSSGLYIDTATFVNTGTITISGFVDIGNGTHSSSFDNAGQITLDSGASFNIGNCSRPRWFGGQRVVFRSFGLGSRRDREWQAL